MLPQPLPCLLYSDKVLHLEPNSWTKCNTLSGGNYVRQGKAEPAPSLSFSRTILLDDRTPCRRDEVFDSFGSSLSRRGRILQQLHPQRQLVYASFYPHFDGDGLWFYRDIGFSRSGSLTKTLIDLVVRSPTGMTAETLGAKLRVRCHSVLVQLCRNGKIQRQKMARSHVYFSIDPPIANVQRRAMFSRKPAELPAEIAVLILVEFIQNPDASFEDLKRAISRKTRVATDVRQIQWLFEQHGLKKTTSTQAPPPGEP